MKLPVNYNTLTPQQRKDVRHFYGELQGWKCKHCGGDLFKGPTKAMMDKPINLKLFPPGFLRHPVHLHHDHKTGLTIGAVHARCNGILWQYHGE